MIDATRIETPEVERPDLYIGIGMIEFGRAGTTDAFDSPTQLPRNCVAEFRLPGTRREKLTKEREQLIADVVAAVRAWDANETIAGTTVINAARRLSDFDTALLDLDAEGVKP